MAMKVAVEMARALAVGAAFRFSEACGTDMLFLGPKLEEVFSKTLSAWVGQNKLREDCARLFFYLDESDSLVDMNKAELMGRLAMKKDFKAREELKRQFLVEYRKWLSNPHFRKNHTGAIEEMFVMLTEELENSAKDFMAHNPDLASALGKCKPPGEGNGTG